MPDKTRSPLHKGQPGNWEALAYFNICFPSPVLG